MGDHLGAQVVADHSGAGTRLVPERDRRPADGGGSIHRLAPPADRTTQ